MYESQKNIFSLANGLNCKLCLDHNQLFHLWQQCEEQDVINLLA
jgi:hypothetical protein